MTGEAEQPPIEPRVLNAELAAVYFGCTKRVFLRRCRNGLYPRPIRGIEALGWDRAMLDAWLDRQAGANENRRQDPKAAWLAAVTSGAHGAD